MKQRNTWQGPNWLILCVIAFVFTSFYDCQNNQTEGKYTNANVSTELEPLYNEVMAVHDEMMPELQTITGFQTQIRAAMDSVRSIEPLDKKRLKILNTEMGSLNRAENAMWSWMHNFGQLDSIPEAEKRRFLENEKATVDNMKEIMVSSIESAKAFLNAQE